MNGSHSIFATASKDSMAELGRRHRGGHILQQAGYTFGLIERIQDQLAAQLPQGFFEATRQVYEEVQSGIRERADAITSSKRSTEIQNQMLGEVQAWRRSLACLGQSARLLGLAVPVEMTKVGKVKRTVPNALRDLNQGISLIEKHRETLAAFPLTEIVLAQGKELLARLSEQDKQQETRHKAIKPSAVKAFHEAKGRLYTALKIIHQTARALLAGDPDEARKFNLTILRRRRSAPVEGGAESVEGTDPSTPATDERDAA